MEVWKLLPLLLPMSLAIGNINDALNSYETLHFNHLQHKIIKRDLSSGTPHTRQVEFNSFGRHFHLYLQKKTSLLSSSFKVVAVDSNNNHRDVDLTDPHPYEGYLIGDPTSEVHAVFEDDDLAASIYTKDDVITIEPSWRHLPHNANYSMIIYRKSDIRRDNDVGDSYCGYVDANKEYNIPETFDPDHYDDHEHSYNQHQHMWNKPTSKKGDRLKRDTENLGGSKHSHRSCQILLVADYHFFKNMGKSSISKASTYLIALMDRVNKIYRNTEFGGPGYSGMGFEITQIRIHEEFTKPSNRTKQHHFNEKLSSPWKTKSLLEAFSNDKTFPSYCVAHLFTYQPFPQGVLGLAYIGSPRRYSVGGICSPVYVKLGVQLYLNTAWTSSLNKHGRRLLTQEADLVTAHELAHNWGGEHDPDTRECAPSAFNDGKYIMYTYSVSGFERNNKFFSPCTRRSIYKVLREKAYSCFKEKSDSYCGNSLVEKDEDCDVGATGLEDSDPCCNNMCKFKQHANCSDMNDLCCKNCLYADENTVCHERLPDAPTCLGESKCTGLSPSCPEAPPVENNLPCVGRGSCKDGECIPLCESHGLISCICDVVETSCQWCCKERTNSTCSPYIDPVRNNTDNRTSPLLPDGMPCVQGSCDKGVCQRQTQDMIQRIWKIIENITPDQLVQFMRANIVGTVIMLSLVIWIPVSCFVSWRDRKLLRSEKEQRNWYLSNNETLYRSQDASRVRSIKMTHHRISTGHHGSLIGPGRKIPMSNMVTNC